MRIGIYQTYWGRVGGGQRFIAVVAEVLARDHSVEIVHHAADFHRNVVEEPMQVDLTRVCFRYVPRVERPNWPTSNPWRRLRLERQLGKEISSPYDLFIESSDIPPLFNHAKRGAILTHFPLVSFDEYHARGTPEWKSRSFLKRCLASTYQQLEWRQRFASYRLYMVNSEFTRRWLKKLWGLDASVVFPPLRDGLNPKPKQKIILSIGAFRSAQHKKQSVTIDAFKTLCARGVDDWRYVMVGACGSNDEDKSYVQSLRQSANGFPIDIITDVSGEELKSRLESSSILWHSMGYGVDEEREPRRMEHFGMVATEALAAGCVPVVFRGGGLPEIVISGKTGYLWSTPDELIDSTIKLIQDTESLKKISHDAVRDAERFAGPAFEDRLFGALEKVLK